MKQNNKNILNKTQSFLIASLLSFIFTKKVEGQIAPPLMYMAPPPPLEIFSTFANFFSGVFLILSALMAVIFLVAKKRKSKRKWPKILLLIFISLTILWKILSFAGYFFNDFLGYY